MQQLQIQELQSLEPLISGRNSPLLIVLVRLERVKLVLSL